MTEETKTKKFHSNKEKVLKLKLLLSYDNLQSRFLSKTPASDFKIIRHMETVFLWGIHDLWLGLEMKK